MNNKVAKRIKNEIYGDFSPKFRKYFVNPKTRQIICDEKRRAYQQAKRDYVNNKKEN